LLISPDSFVFRTRSIASSFGPLRKYELVSNSGLYHSQRSEKEFRSCQGYGHVSYQRLHEGKDRDTDFAGCRNPCSGFRGDDKQQVKEQFNRDI